MPPYKVLQRNTELKKKIKNKKTKTNKRRGWPNFSFVCTINIVQGFFFLSGRSWSINTIFTSTKIFILKSKTFEVFLDQIMAYYLEKKN